MVTAREPMVILDRNLRVVAASRAYYKMFPIKLAAQGRPFCELNSLQWDASTEQALRDAVLGNKNIDDYEVDLEVPGQGRRRLRLNARQVAEQGNLDASILVNLEDLTAQREAEELKDALFKRQEMLLLEVHHRVANSLQIIASVLQMKARTVHSEEARELLRDVQKRLILVATVQRQLCTPGFAEEIELGPYLRQLCDGLASSMIGENDAVAITASATAGTIKPEEAVNFGLIVTELVINALKHGFPDGRHGHILVSFVATGRGWKLSVSDDGVGRLPATAERGHTGLGTSIIEALARQLGAEVTITINCPGAATTITHIAQELP
jgi:chemotaxis protein methyltransferase CheR